MGVKFLSFPTGPFPSRRLLSITGRALTLAVTLALTLALPLALTIA